MQGERFTQAEGSCFYQPNGPLRVNRKRNLTLLRDDCGCKE